MSPLRGRAAGTSPPRRQDGTARRRPRGRARRPRRRHALRRRPGEKVATDGRSSRATRGRPVDDHGRAGAGRGRSRRRGHRRDDQRQRALVVEATRVGAGTALAQIVRLVDEAQARAPIHASPTASPASSSRGPGDRARDAVVWFATGHAADEAFDRGGRGPHHRLPVRARAGDADGDHGRHRTPRSSASSSRAARSSNTRQVDVVVLDKTGTLTEGRMVSDRRVDDGGATPDLLRRRFRRGAVGAPDRSRPSPRAPAAAPVTGFANVPGQESTAWSPAP